MANKAILNRQIQVLENALIELRKHYSNTINEINKKIRCTECRKVMIEHAKKRNREFNILAASLFGSLTHVDYSAEPYKLFDKEVK